ncbi:MAG: ADP-forming succinate--CoA ligase subunit beta [Chloroflexi bacterium]|nr:MAG: ADP-forming succinate--CoA ligase subunit beta [Chloroflexota bacterium]
MNLHEYQSKRIFGQHGIPVPSGEVAGSAEEAYQAARALGGTSVIKAQVLTGGRGKAGGVKVAKTPGEAEALAAQILGMNIRGLTVKQVLVDPAADIRHEIYLGVVLDRASERLVMIASAAGGMDIEEVARTAPEKIQRIVIDPALGLPDFQARALAFGIGIDRGLRREFTHIARALYHVAMTHDVTLAEINPLAIVGDGKLLALDGKIVLDDNALFRHPELAALRDQSAEDKSELEARKHGLSYVKLDGKIGCMVNGAGLAMATMDVIHYFGGSPANFLDIGGGAQADKVAAALRIILSDPNVNAVLFNIFGGITRCDEVAKGIVAALGQVNTPVPMVVRLVGTNEAEGRAILANAQMETAKTLSEAAQKAVELSERGSQNRPEKRN